MPIGKPDFSGLFFTVNGSGFLYSDFVNAVTRVLRVRSWQQLMSDVPPMTVAGRRGHGYRALSLLPSQQANRAKEIVVAVVAVFEAPNLSQEQYEESVRRLTSGGKSRMESPSDWLVPGLLVHVAGQGKNGFRVVDVWESDEAFRRFGDHNAHPEGAWARHSARHISVSGACQRYPSIRHQEAASSSVPS